VKKSKEKPSLGVVGRERELEQLGTALRLNRNLLIEGPVGVGKTFLVQQVLNAQDRGFERVDGDTRYTEQKLTGWFDPPIVLKKGYVAAAFLDGPLVTAMRKGRVLFVNELNRMPESVQNILLPAMDERRIVMPKLGEVKAKDGFCVMATQNPREFTATHALSEALLDRFEMIHLDYQTRAEEVTILNQEVAGAKRDLLERALDLVRSTRQHASIKRGASVRAAIAIARLVDGGVDYPTACLMALPSRIEMISSEEDPREIIRQLMANGTLPLAEEKKKELSN
jgi:MoxR-like ATPase